MEEDIPEETNAVITPDAISADDALIDFKNPFDKKALTKIEFTIRKPYTKGDEVEHTSQVWFKKSGTTGIQDIEADVFSALVRKTKIFIDSL